MRKAEKKILSLALAILLAAGTLPQAVFAVGKTPPVGASGEIIAFEPLEDSVAHQSMPLGTLLEDLDLPDTLTATVEVEAAAEQNGSDSESVQDSGEPAQNDLADTNTDTQNGTPSDAQQFAGSDDLLQIQAITGSALALGNSGVEDSGDTGSTQKTLSVVVLEWTSEPDYNPEATGTYTFTPVLDDSWSLADGVELPEITVQEIAGIMMLSGSPSTGTMTIGGTSGYNLAIDQGGNGWSWLASTSTLTLDSSYAGQDINFQCATEDTIFVEYSGDVTINGKLWSDGSMDIRCTGADTDKLTVTNSTAAISPLGDLVIRSGTISAYSGGNAAFNVYGSFSILGSTKIEAQGSFGDLSCGGTITIDTTGGVYLRNSNPANYVSSGTLNYVNGTLQTGDTIAIAPTVSDVSDVTVTVGENVTRTVDLGAGYFEATGCTVISDDPGIASAVLNNNTITLTGVDIGTTSVTITWVGGTLAGQTVSIDVQVTAPWGVDGIFDLSALPDSDKTSTDPNTPWSWNSTEKTLTLTGSGSYTLTGTGTASIAANMIQDMEIILDNGHLTAPHSTVNNGRNALTVTGSNKLTITGNGSMAGGTGDFFGGRGIDASGSTGELIVSGNLDISGGSGQAGMDGILSGGKTTLSGEIKLTGGNGSSSGTAGNGFYGMPGVSLFLLGEVEATGGDSSATFIQSGRAVVVDNIHFMDTSASLIAKNGLSIASSISLDLINDTANTRWDIAPSAITGGGTVNDPSITVDIPAYPDSVTIRLATTIQPGITTSPVNQAVTEGQMATFSVTATGIQLSYQWQVDKQDGSGFQNVTDGTGGNTAQYTTPMTDVSMSGYTYRVIVSNMGGDATSNTAVLTVNALVNAAKNITAFQLNGVNGTISGNNITVTLPAGADVTNAVPIITHTGASVTPASGVAQDFTSPVTYTVTAQDSSTKSYTVTVSTLVNAETPNITTQPQDAAYNQGITATALTVAANVADGGTLSYQWYSNTTNSTAGSAAISGETASSYTPETNMVGDLYYYCVVTNTNSGVNGTPIATATSSIVKITVTSNSGGSGSSSSDNGSTPTYFNGNILVYGVNVPYSIYTSSGVMTLNLTASLLDQIVTAAGGNKTIAINAGTRSGLKELIVKFPPSWFANHTDITFPVQSSIGGIELNNNLSKQFPAQNTAATVSLQSGSLIFSANQSGKTVTWNDASAPVAIYMPYMPPMDINTNAIVLYNKTTGTIAAHSFYSSGKVYGLVSAPGTYDAKIGAGSFSDTQGYWAMGDITFAASHGLISGTSATAFSPDTAITRAGFLMALGKLSGADVSSYKQSSFTDVANDSSAMPYIQWAVANKIVQGIGNNQFAPNQAITREQMAVMLTAYAKATGQTLPQVRTAITFGDNKNISEWAKEAVLVIQRADIINGKYGNVFDPQGNATRAEASTILRRYAENVVSGEKGWVQNADGQQMYIDSDYLPRKGWLVIANTDTKYYFDANGLMVSGKWLQIDGKWYYFNGDGKMARGTTIEGYIIDENGVRE